ncbi:MAG: MoaD/ThiS family protein [bacterium]|nr:MoaD/ThiS family protein [bacterium]
MKVIFKVYTYLKAELGAGELHLDFPGREEVSLDEVLNEVEKVTSKKIRDKVLKDGRIKEGLIFVLNGKSVVPENVSQVFLKDGDVISILPPGSGG